jgi:formylglycine-generating enzyme required for sulfatase activity
VAFDEGIPPAQPARTMAAVIPQMHGEGPRQAMTKTAPKQTDQMVLVPGGQFYVSVDDDVAVNTQRNLLPTLHKPSFVLEIPAFYVDKQEVTNAQYQAFVQVTGYHPPRHWDGLQIPQGLENAPVVNVTYHDAAAYAAWAGKRLPSELEWQRASEEASMMVAVEVARTQQTLRDQAFSILSLIAGFQTVLAAEESALTTFEYVMDEFGGRVAEWTSSSAVVDRSSPLAQVSGMFYTNASKYGQHRIVRQGFVADNEGVEYRSTHHQAVTSDRIGFRCVTDIL